MTGDVTISLWLFLLLLIITILAVLDRILIPSTRWFLRRRINRVINEIGSRLDIGIRPFQLTKRQVLIDRLVYDTEVVKAIQDHARIHDMPLELVQNQAIRYAREIVPSFNAYLYFRIGYWVAKRVARLFYRVRVGLIDDDRFVAIDPEATVVFVMNHRSNMDYVLVAFLAAERTTLSYAVGEWAKVWPLQMLIRAMGAFFVRRRSGNPLYRRVLERYIHMATREGVCQAIFPEGGLSRDGRLQAPKLGLIDYMLRHFNMDTDRDIVFIPVGINYDRVVEDRSLVRAQDPSAEKRSMWYVFHTTARFLLRNLMLMIFSRWRHYGYAVVNFGAPLSIRDYCRENSVCFNCLERASRFAEVERLSRWLMTAIADVVPLLPVSILSKILLEAGDAPMDFSLIETRGNRLWEELRTKGAPVVDVSRSTRTQILADTIDFLLMRHLVVRRDDGFSAATGEEPILAYYANAIGHWWKPEDGDRTVPT